LVRQNLKKAFSLLELIFVIAVLGIIAAVAVPKLMDSRNSAIVTTINQDVSTITTAVQSYYMLNNKIDKISDAVNINAQNWTIADLKVEYKIGETLCVSIAVANSKLNVNIFEEDNILCKKIYDTGVRDISYDLL
jgi:general secretion pathway protein G